MRMATDRNWITIRAAADYFGLKPRTLYVLVARRLLPRDAVLRIGKQIRICPKLVEAGLALRNGSEGKKCRRDLGDREAPPAPGSVRHSMRGQGAKTEEG